VTVNVRLLDVGPHAEVVAVYPLEAAVVVTILHARMIAETEITTGEIEIELIVLEVQMIAIVKLRMSVRMVARMARRVEIGKLPWIRQIPLMMNLIQLNRQVQVQVKLTPTYMNSRRINGGQKLLHALGVTRMILPRLYSIYALVLDTYL